MTPDNPKIVIIAGPNGAGKTTFAREFLPREAGCPRFVNADLIASGLSPFEPEKVAFRAGRMMLEEIARHAAERRSFAFETTLSGVTYGRRSELMSDPMVSRLPDDDMQAAPAALLRAGRQAREIARQTGTAVVVMRDGKLVEAKVSDERPEGPGLAATQER